jgi:hypothetical protein
MAEATLYYRTADGVLTSRVVTGETVEEPALPEGATELTAEQYETALAAVNEARQEHAEELVATDQANAHADYEALLASGIPEATARRLTGYAGEENDA